MTAQEAISNCRKLIKLLENADSNVDWSTAIETLNMAVDALEKQIPKKVRIEHALPKYGYASFCPNCDRMDIGGWSYCPDCGQAIDWNEDKS